MKAKVLWFFILLTTFFFTFTNNANAGDNGWNCDLNLSSSLVLLNGQIQITSNNISQNNVPQTIPGNDSYYIRVTPGHCGPLGNAECRFYLSRPTFVPNPGELSITLSKDSEGKSIFSTLGDQVNISLVKDTGPFTVHENICQSSTIVKVVSSTACIPGDFSVAVPTSVNRLTPTNISISANTGATYDPNLPMYLFIKNQQTGTVLGGQSSTVNLDANGQAQVQFLFDSVAIEASNGTFVAELKQSNNINALNCNNTTSFDVVGEPSCQRLGDACDPNSSKLPCNLNAICGENGLWQLPPLSTFDHICITKNPPTCEECEIFPDGTRNCYPNPVHKEAICYRACNPFPSWPTTSNNSLLCGTYANTGINTAIGCIPLVNTNNLFVFLLKWGLSFAGGVAFLTIIIASFLIIISRGNPERIKSGKELLTASISGLLLLIFSVVILRIIGVNILGIFQ